MTSFTEFPKDGYSFSAAEVGQALAGLVQQDSSGFPKEGVISKPAISAVAGAWKVQIGRFVFVRNVSGSARFSGLSSAEQIDIANASTLTAGQSRIDRIAWNPINSTLVYIQGTPGSSPVAPDLGSHKPLVKLVVQAGDSMVVAARLTLEFVYVGGSGDKRPVATSTIVHYLGASTVPSFSVATNLDPVDYPRVLMVDNGDFGANLARFNMVSPILPAGATNAVIGWTGAGIGNARVNFIAIPVEQ